MFYIYKLEAVKGISPIKFRWQLQVTTGFAYIDDARQFAKRVLDASINRSCVRMFESYAASREDFVRPFKTDERIWQFIQLVDIPPAQMFSYEELEDIGVFIPF